MLRGIKPDKFIGVTKVSEYVGEPSSHNSSQNIQVQARGDEVKLNATQEA